MNTYLLSTNYMRGALYSVNMNKTLPSVLESFAMTQWLVLFLLNF